MPEVSSPARHGGSRGTVVLATVALLALVLWVIGAVLEVLLLCFVGLLLGLFFYGSGAWLAQRLGVPAKPMVIAFALVLVGVASVTVWLAAPAVATQVDELTATLPRALEEATKPLAELAGAPSLVGHARHPEKLIAGGATWARAGGVISTTLGGLGSLMVVAFIGLFVGYDPHLYRRGLLALIPERRRGRADEVLHATAHALQMWMVGKLMSMTLVGIGAWIGLTLLGVPLALVLALLAAVLDFIPNFGPVLAAVPAILLGLLQGPSQALWVASLYIGLQTVESFIFEPILQKKMVQLPPALTIVSQVVMGSLAGGIGIIVATPLTAAALVLTKELYVKDFLDSDHEASQSPIVSSPATE